MSFFKSIKRKPIPTAKVYSISALGRMIDKTREIMYDPYISDCSLEKFEYSSVYNCGQLYWTYNGKALPENKKIHAQLDSSITHISNCTFHDIKLSDSYVIRLDKEVSFEGNHFEFSFFDDYPTPIYLNNIFHGKHAYFALYIYQMQIKKI